MPPGVTLPPGALTLPLPSAGSPDIGVLDSFSLFHAISAPEMEKFAVYDSTFVFCFFFLLSLLPWPVSFLLPETARSSPETSVPEGLHPCLLSQSPLPSSPSPLQQKCLSWPAKVCCVD